MNATPNGAQESLDFIIQLMATKADIAALDTRLERVEDLLERVEDRLVQVEGRMDKVGEKLVRIDERLLNIEQELRVIRTDLDILRTKVENIDGYRLEIDHALERIAVIEKHLGIRSKLAT